MGKRYYCDYCDKSMAATRAIIRTHMKGLMHQKFVLENYQQFKDPETILAEEDMKLPCTRFPKGECKFGSMCRFSHYSKQQIDEFREIVVTKHRLQTEITQSFEDLYQKLQDQRTETQRSEDGNTVLYDKNGKTHVFPWVYNDALNSYGENLPPSIKQLNIEDFQNASIQMWG